MFFEMMANIFFIYVKETFVEKSFSAFGGARGRPLNTLKLFLAKCFIIFFKLMKNTFAIISRLFSPKYAGIIY